MMNLKKFMPRGLLPAVGILALFAAACTAGQEAGSSVATSTMTPESGAAGAADASISAPPPANSPFSGPLVGFYIEDSYEDVYLSIFDAGTGAFRVIQSAIPIYIGEAQWFDNGCRLFVHGQLIDLNGVPEWSVPPEVAGRIEQINAAGLSPGRRYIAHVVSSGESSSSGSAAADVEVIVLSPPFDAVRLTSGSDAPRALAWSADEAWIYFTEYDASGILQVFRATPDGSMTEQLTSHTEPIAVINALSPSPDGRHVAYSVQNLLQAGRPYTYQPADEGWVGIIDLVTGTSAAVRPEKFATAQGGQGLVWDSGGKNLLIIGDTLPVDEADPLAGRRVIWVTEKGEVTRSIGTADSPGGADDHIGWVAPLGDIDTLLVSVLNRYYRYDKEGFQELEGTLAPPFGIASGHRPITILPAPIGFPGEEGCKK